MSVNHWAGMVLVKTKLTKSHFMPMIRKPLKDPDMLIKGKMLHVLEKNRFGDCLCVVFNGDNVAGMADISHEDVRIFIPQRAIQIVKTGIDPEGSIEYLAKAFGERLEKGEDLTPVVDALLNKLADRGSVPEPIADLFANIMKGTDMTKQKPILTTNPTLKHGDVYHALQGNGPGCIGQFFRGVTWCGLELNDEGEESTHPVTCGECVDAREYADAETRARHEDPGPDPKG
jgi:hypothetical protein